MARCLANGLIAIGLLGLIASGCNRKKKDDDLCMAQRIPDGPRSSTTRYRSLAGSGGATCGLHDDHTLQCWGSPAPLPGGELINLRWRQHLCGLDGDGMLHCAKDTRGDDLSYLPREPLVDFAEGSFHGCGIRKADGTIVCWAQEKEDQVSPPEGSFRQVTSGVGFSCALDHEGQATCFGPEAPAHTPTDRFETLSAGLSQVCGVLADGRLACWGPAHVPPVGQFAHLSCRNWRCCAIASDATLTCWGEPLAGGPPPGAFEVIDVAPDHACASGQAGTVCWGSNHLGQLNVVQQPTGHNWIRPSP